jgi:predicted dehydrogenase
MVKLGIMSFAHMHGASYAAAAKSLPGCTLVGVADEDKDRGAKMAARFETERFDSFEALCKSDVDGVVIASDNRSHLPLTLLATLHGKHVLCEKPIARTADEAIKMIASADKAGVILATAFPCRFIPAMREIKRMIDDGDIGPIRAIRGTNHGMMPGGWFVEKERSGGGAVIDHTVHVADLMRWFVSSEVKEVYAEVDTLFYDNMDADDTGMLSLVFENGVFATLDTSWSRPPRSFPTWGDVTMKIVLENGTVEVDTFNQKIDFYDEAAGKGRYLFFGDDMDRGLVANFVAAIDGREKISATGRDGLAALQVALAAYESALKAAPVAVTSE